MDKQAITGLLHHNYSSFVVYVNGLTAEEYVFTSHRKWTAAQQLEHIVLCVKPLVQVFSMDKTTIAQTFGQTDKAGRSYEALLSDYLVKLNDGGKAPERFVPPTTPANSKEALCESLTKLINDLCSKIETFNESELDTLLIPHPLLGPITLREMLYNAIYHVGHHQAQAEENLKNK